MLIPLLSARAVAPGLPRNSLRISVNWRSDIVDKTKHISIHWSLKYIIIEFVYFTHLINDIIYDIGNQ